MKLIHGILLIHILLFSVAFAQAETRKEFIRKYTHIAIKEMERTGIPASIKLAQGILESGCGQSELCVNANNHFGIKCHDWTGATYHMDDDLSDECFRKYKNPEQSWVDHSTFLTTRPRYASLFDIPTTDYKAWAKGLKAAGYATNPQYAERLIKIIEEEELYKFDRLITKPGGHSISAAEYAESLSTVNRPGSSGYKKREEMRNGILCIEIQEGDSLEKIARYYGIKLKKLMQYNDKSDLTVEKGQIVYLKNKKRKAARGYEFHRVKAGDTLYEISQMYGVRIKNLKKYNYMGEKSEPVEGEKIYLRNNAPLF